MLVHLFKLIWKRKKLNALIIAEVAIAFMIVFAISSTAIHQYRLYIEPLGFEYHNMWNLRFSGISNPWQDDRDPLQLRQVVRTLKQQSEIKKVHLLKNPTFIHWRGSSSYELDGKNFHFLRNYMDDDAPETFGMKIIKGRWFGIQDEGQGYRPTIVNRRFVEEFYPNEDPIGKNIARKTDDQGNILKEQRIVGVFEDFRQQGELNKLTPYVIYRYDINSGGKIHNIEIKLREGINISYEKKLMELLNDIAPSWKFSINPWEESRQTALDEALTPLVFGAIIASFFILLVAMGLFGVLWQNVTSRTPEIGLRQAIGATTTGIHLQIISELLIVTLLGIMIAFIILVQLPILGDLSWSLFWSGQAASILFMILLSVSCAYYPGKLATKLSPAEALHYE